jgi:glycosyltransferase involved in cell wall biosynthesis
MRILHLVGRSHRRGAEQVAVELAEELGALGHGNRLLAVGLGHQGGRDADIPAVTGAVRQTPVALVWAAVGLRRDLRRHPVDVVLAHGGSAAQVAVGAGFAGPRPPLVYQLILSMPVHERGRLWRAWWRFVLARTAGAVALTPVLAEEIRELGLRAPVWLVPNARRPERFFAVDRTRAGAELRRDLGLPPGAPVVGFVGHLVEQKRPDLAVEVLERVRAAGVDAHLVVVGGGPLAIPVAELVAERGLGASVSLLGHRSDVEQVLGGLDVLVLPSDDEGMPGVAIEAQMAGCPVVSFPVGGAAEVLAGGGGVVTAAHDVEEMAAAVVELLADPDRRATMSERARAGSEPFTMAAAARSYERHLAEVVGSVAPVSTEPSSPASSASSSSSSSAASAPAASKPGDEASLRIAASPDAIYAIVTDIAGMGRLSPECTGGRWLDGAAGPAVGARFKGTNRRGLARWSTTNRVVAADPGREFAFETVQSGMRWRYRMEPDGDGTVVTESREAWGPKPLIAKVFSALALGGGDRHDDELRAGMVATLERLRAVAEAPA